MQPSAELMKAVYEAVRSVYPDAVWEEAPKWDAKGGTVMSAWQEILKLAEQHGYVVQAAGGTAVLATRETQKETLGETKYYRIQRMNGHCPLKWGETSRCGDLGPTGRHCEECSLAEQSGLQGSDLSDRIT